MGPSGVSPTPGKVPLSSRPRYDPEPPHPHTDGTFRFWGPETRGGRGVVATLRRHVPRLTWSLLRVPGTSTVDLSSDSDVPHCGPRRLGPEDHRDSRRRGLGTRVGSGSLGSDPPPPSDGDSVPLVKGGRRVPCPVGVVAKRYKDWVWRSGARGLTRTEARLCERKDRLGQPLKSWSDIKCSVDLVSYKNYF